MPPPSTIRCQVYSDEERRLIDPFKEEYMKTTTSEWKTIAQVKIFPALFTYWSSIGVDLNPGEMDRRSEVSCR